MPASRQAPHCRDNAGHPCFCAASMTAPVALAELIVGDHPSIVALRDLVLRVARSHASTVLLYGETGTGKGLVARALHEHSSRADKGFTEINCAAIPGNLLESELFGHERGAFTGAVARKVGLLETAHGGSVFLDEVRELDPMMQAKLLTLLDSRRFRRIGAVREVCPDVRFIAATNKILLGEVNAGKFRDDLYYRLQVVSINLPPLRERGDDIFVLAERFLARFNRLHASHFERLDAPLQPAFRRYASTRLWKRRSGAMPGRAMCASWATCWNAFASWRAAPGWAWNICRRASCAAPRRVSAWPKATTPHAPQPSSAA